MKQINKLGRARKAAEKFILSYDWAYQNLTKLSAYILRVLAEHEKRYYLSYIDRKIESLGLTGSAKAIAEMTARTSLDALMCEKSASGGRSSVPTEVVVNIVITAAVNIYTELKYIVGIQPMPTPVAQVFSMQYKEEKSNDNPPEGLESMRSMTLEIVARAVSATSRKLQAGWTLEAMQDLKTMHGLDIEKELEKALAAEITYEVVNEVINNLLDGVEETDSEFSFAKLNELDPEAMTSSWRIGIEVNQICNEIARKTRRGAGNFIICSPLVVAMLQSAPKAVFAPAVTGELAHRGEVLKLCGTLNGTIRVFSYMWPTQSDNSDKILIGYKGGNGEVDTGYVYSPYVLAMTSGVTVNPVTFQPVINLGTRAAHTYLDRNYYGVLNLK